MTKKKKNELKNKNHSAPGHLNTIENSYRSRCVQYYVKHTSLNKTTNEKMI